MMKKQICTIVFLSYFLSLCAAHDAFNEASAQDGVLPGGDIQYPAFIPESREKHGGETSDESRRWLAYHPEKNSYLAIAAGFDPMNTKDKKSVFYRVRELPGCVMIALFEGQWDKRNDALGEVLRNFLNSIDGDAVCADARHSAERLGETVKRHASIFGKEIIEREDKILAQGNAEEHKVVFARQWHRETVAMYLIMATAWPDKISPNAKRYCRLMCWMPNVSREQCIDIQENSIKDKFISPLIFSELNTSGDCEPGKITLSKGVEKLNSHQQCLVSKNQDIVCLARAMGEHMQRSSASTHHVWMAVDMKALEEAVKKSIPVEQLQRCDVDEKELSNDFLEYQSSLQPIVNAALANYCAQRLSGFAQIDKAIERLKPLLMEVLIEYRKRGFGSFSKVVSYGRFDEQAFAIFKVKCAHEILAVKCNGMSITRFLNDAAAKQTPTS